MKALFLLKKNLSSVVDSPVKSSGLFNSATMTALEIYTHLGVDSKVEICADANEIDKKVHHYKPDFIILEAIWVTPKKLQELKNKYKNKTFIIRIHSEFPFLANEGNALTWIKEFAEIDGVYVAFNSAITSYEAASVLGGNITYLPNLYNSLDIKTTDDIIPYSLNSLNGDFHVGCFGAIRPLKNQLIQAVAAILFANKYGVNLKFHMNIPRTEQGGEAVLKNIRALFAGTQHELVGHGWLDRYDFLKLIDSMHIGLQLSFTESFNIVTADFVAMNVPIVVSQAVRWMHEQATAPVDDAFLIASKMEEIFSSYIAHAKINKAQLINYNNEALTAWQQLFP